ncbi:MAG TPA: hypothetical protein VGK81_09720, partial [Anaerolineae bacterium]
MLKHYVHQRAHHTGMQFLAVLVVVALLAASHARRAAADTITIDFEPAAAPQAMRPAITTSMSDRPATL